MADTTRSLRFVSWKVNGLRAVLKKEPSFTQIFDTLGADVFAVQETKLQEGQVELDLPGYHQYWSYAERKGYSGTAVFTREEPLQVVRKIGSPVADDEGRVCRFMHSSSATKRITSTFNADRSDISIYLFP